MAMRTVLPTLVSLSMTLGTFGFPTAAVAKAPFARVSSASASALETGRVALAPAGVLGLDAEDDAAGEALTSALRKSFAARGLEGGEELSLVEMRLTMGCEDDSPECLTKVGEALGVDRVVYGYLKGSSAGGYQLELYILDAAQGVIEAQTKTPLEADALSSENVDDTADRIVGSLLGEEEEEAEPAPPPPLITTDTEPRPGAGPADRPPGSRIVWGRESPTPTWKWVGLGVSAGLLVASVAAAGGLTYAICSESDPHCVSDGPLRKELIETAEESSQDGIPSNDIDPASEDICAAARVTPAGAEAGSVTNAAVTRVCNRADGFVTAANVSWGLVGVSAVSTIIFTTLLFVHREEPGAQALRRRKVEVSAGPTRDGGLMMGGSFRF